MSKTIQIMIDKRGVVTNGDVIKAMFLNVRRWGTVLLNDNEGVLFTNINLEWWNKPYKESEEDME